MIHKLCEASNLIAVLSVVLRASDSDDGTYNGSGRS